jgi:hypothetical protein
MAKLSESQNVHNFFPKYVQILSNPCGRIAILQNAKGLKQNRCKRAEGQYHKINPLEKTAKFLFFYRRSWVRLWGS